VIFSRPDTGLTDGFGIAVDIVRSAGGAELLGIEPGDETFAADSLVAELLVAEAGWTSTFMNVLCGSKLAATCVGTAPLRAYTPTESSMLWLTVASQLKNLGGAWRVTVGDKWKIGGKTGTNSAEDGTFAGIVCDAHGVPRYSFAAFIKGGGKGGGVAAEVSADLMKFIVGN
jgi:hypothetical protein